MTPPPTRERSRRAFAWSLAVFAAGVLLVPLAIFLELPAAGLLAAAGALASLAALVAANRLVLRHAPPPAAPRRAFVALATAVWGSIGLPALALADGGIESLGIGLAVVLGMALSVAVLGPVVLLLAAGLLSRWTTPTTAHAPAAPRPAATARDARTWTQRLLILGAAAIGARAAAGAAVLFEPRLAPLPPPLTGLLGLATAVGVVGSLVLLGKRDPAPRGWIAALALTGGWAWFASSDVLEVAARNDVDRLVDLALGPVGAMVLALPIYVGLTSATLRRWPPDDAP